MAETKTQGTNVKADTVNSHVMDVLQKVREGDMLFDLSQQLQDVVNGIREAKTGGSITLKLTINPLSAGNSDTVTITDKITVKIPKAQTKPTIFFTTPKNTLSRKDPRQTEFAEEAGFAG